MHTPGPWTFHDPQWGFSKITGPNGELIFGTAAGGPDEKQPDEVCDANAMLIQAAPDMLTALRELLEFHNEGRIPNAECLARAEIAIAKATAE